MVWVASASPRKPALTAPSLRVLEVASVTSHPGACPSKESGPQAPGKSEFPPAPGSGGRLSRWPGAWKSPHAEDRDGGFPGACGARALRAGLAAALVPSFLGTGSALEREMRSRAPGPQPAPPRPPSCLPSAESQPGALHLGLLWGQGGVDSGSCEDTAWG